MRLKGINKLESDNASSIYQSRQNAKQAKMEENASIK